MDYIGFCNYNGSQRYNVLRDGGKIRHPFSIALFEDTVFWSDWDRKQVKRGNKFHGGDAALIHAALFRPMDLHVVHPVQQPRGKGLCHAMSECLVVNCHPMRDCQVSSHSRLWDRPLGDLSFLSGFTSATVSQANATSKTSPRFLLFSKQQQEQRSIQSTDACVLCRMLNLNFADSTLGYHIFLFVVSGVNYCLNSSCSHLCLLKPQGYSCNCPVGMVLQDDNVTCLGKSAHLTW